MNKIDGNGSINFLQGDVGPIEQTLPFELIKNILFFVDDRALQSAVTVCRRWSLASVGAGAEKRFGLLLPFAKFLRQHLNKETYDSNQIEQFKVIECDTTLFGSKNLVVVKSSFLALKEKFINILKDLKKEDLAALTRLSNELPEVNELCSLAILYKEIDEANANLDELTKNLSLSRISEKLANAGRMDKAIEVASLAGGYKSVSFFVICSNLIQKGQIDEAIEVIMILDKNDLSRSDVLKEISDIYIKKRQIDKAIELAKAMSEYRYIQKGMVIENICEALIQDGQVDKAIETSTTLLEFHANELSKYGTLKRIYEAIDKKSN